MHSKRFNYTNPQLKKLKSEVERVFGRRILNTKDCIQLQQEIALYSTFKSSLGLNTIRRCFGIIKSENALSKYSLDVLSNYSGFNDFFHLLNASTNVMVQEKTVNLNLIKILYGEALEQESSKLFAKLNNESLEAILSNSTLFEKVFPLLSQYPLFQEYVLSFHPLIAKLNQSWYLNRMRSFTQSSEIVHIKVFGLALDYLHLLFNDQIGKCAVLVNDMRRHEPALTKDYPMEAWPHARLYASAYIYYNKIVEENLANDYRQKIIHYLSAQPETEKITLHQQEANQHDFLMCVCDYLSICGHYEFLGLLLQKFDKVFKQGHPSYSRQYQPYKTIVEIIRAEYSIHCGHVAEAKQILRLIRLSNLTFEFKQFYSLRYLMLMMQVSSNHSTSRFKILYSQAEALIESMGYETFKTKLKHIA